MQIARWRRIGYGVAELGASGAEVLLRVSLLIFYTQVVGIEPRLASYAIAIGVIWDALTDPLMGRISDQASIRGQKRRPFMIPGAVGLACSLILLFNVPQIPSQTGKFFYLLAVYLCTNTFLTILSVPHTAFAGDISKEPQVRSELFGWRLLFANFGLILGTAVPAMVVSSDPSASDVPEMVASKIVAIFIILSAVATLWCTKGLDQAYYDKSLQEHKKDSNTNIQSLKKYLQLYQNDLKDVLSHNTFTRLLIAYMIATIALTLNSSLALYYYKFFLKLEEAPLRLIIVFFMIIFCLSIPFWVWISRFFNKQMLLSVNVFLLGLMTTFVYPFLPPQGFVGPLVAGLFGGIFVGSVVLMDVLVADFADEETQKNKKDESKLGIYFGFWKMGSKLSRAIALIVTGNILSLIGYQSGVIPDAQVSFHMALLFGPVVGIFFVLAAIFIYYGYKKGVTYD